METPCIFPQESVLPHSWPCMLLGIWAESMRSCLKDTNAPGASFLSTADPLSFFHVGMGGFQQKRGSATGSGHQQFGSLIDLHSCLPVQKRCRFDPWAGKIPWRRKWQPTPEFLPEESLGRGSLAGYSPRGCKESDTTEVA